MFIMTIKMMINDDVNAKAYSFICVCVTIEIIIDSFIETLTQFQFIYLLFFLNRENNNFSRSKKSKLNEKVVNEIFIFSPTFSYALITQ